MRAPRNAERSHRHGASPIPVAVPASKRSTRDRHRHRRPRVPTGLQSRSNGSFFFGVLVLFLVVETSVATDNEGEESEDWGELFSTLIMVLVWPAFGIISLAMGNAHVDGETFLKDWKEASRTQTARVTSRRMRYTGCCRRKRIDHLTVEYTVVSEHNGVNDPCDDEECPSTNSRTVRCRARSLVVKQEGNYDDNDDDELRIMVHPHYPLSAMTLFDFDEGLRAKNAAAGMCYVMILAIAQGFFMPVFMFIDHSLSESVLMFIFYSLAMHIMWKDRRCLTNWAHRRFRQKIQNGVCCGAKYVDGDGSKDVELIAIKKRTKGQLYEGLSLSKDNDDATIATATNSCSD